MTLCSLVAAVLFAPLVVTAAVGKVEYRLTRCVSSGDAQFAASFVGSEKQQRRIALSSDRFEFGGRRQGRGTLGRRPRATVVSGSRGRVYSTGASNVVLWSAVA